MVAPDWCTPCQSHGEGGSSKPALNETLCSCVIAERRMQEGEGVTFGEYLGVAGAACKGVMAAVAELSLPSIGDSSLERSCSPNLSQEVLCEIFRSLHTLAGQVSGGLWE